GVVLAHKEVPGGKTTKLVVEYEYTVDGRRFACDRIWHEAVGPNYVTERTVAGLVPVGSRVSVSYNPRNPADAVLVPGLPGVDILALWYLYPLNLMLVLSLLTRNSAPAWRVHTTASGWRVRWPEEPFALKFGTILFLAGLMGFWFARDAL